MTALVFVAAFCVVAVLVYLARYSGRVRVVQTRVVDAPWQETRALIVDLRRWPEWIPWLEHRDESRAFHSGDSDAPGGSCRWARGDTDLGRVEHLEFREPGRIEQRLQLWQPFPLRGIVTWQLAESDGKTRVTWSLRGRVGFSMRAFASTVQGALALDFRYGLDRLAGLVEGSAAPRYAVTYAGVYESPALRYAYVEHTGRIEGRGPALREALAALREALARQGVSATGGPMALYAKTRIRERTTTCRFAIPVGDAEIEGLAVATVPAHRAFVVSLLGDPAHLELAWYLAMQRIAALGIRPDLRLMPSEHYLAGSGRAPGDRDLTELRIPVLEPGVQRDGATSARDGDRRHGDGRVDRQLERRGHEYGGGARQREDVGEQGPQANRSHAAPFSSSRRRRERAGPESSFRAARARRRCPSARG